MKATELLNRVPEPVRKSRLIFVGLALALLFVAALFAWPKPQQGQTAYYEVQRGDFTVTVLDRGTLTAVSETSVRSEVEGTARIIYIVPEGTYVKKGDLLVELDSSQAQDQFNLQQINFEKAQFALVQAEAQLKIQESAVDSEISGSDLKVRLAKMDLDKFEEGQRLVELIEATNKVVAAAALLAVNKEKYSWSTKLAAKGFETKQNLDADGLTMTNNQNALMVANNSLWMLQKFDHRKLDEKYKSEWQEAQKELERVKAQSARKIEQYKADLLNQSNTLVLNQKKLERDRKNLEACKIRAKQEGLVVYNMSENRFSSESLIEEGAVVRNRQELIKLPDTSRMKVTIKVHESHVGLVQVGQPAFVKLDSLPDQRFQGVVEKVALLPDSQSRFGNPNLKVYNTEVVITDPLPGVKPGVSAQAEIIITNICNALSVPLQAVTTLKGRQVVYCDQSGKAVPIPVQVGMFNTKFIEISSGLKEGARVLLSPPFDTQEKDLEGAVLAADEKARVATNSAAAAVNARKSGMTNTAGSSARASAEMAAPAARPGDPVDLRNFPPMSQLPDQRIAPRQPDAEGAADPDAVRVAMATRSPNGEGTPGTPPRLTPEEMLKRFDKNADGQLDEEEKAAMRQVLGPRGARGPRPGRPEGRRPSPNATAAGDTAPTSAPPPTP